MRQIPIILIAHSRLHYVSETFGSLLRQPNLNIEKVYAFIDGPKNPGQIKDCDAVRSYLERHLPITNIFPSDVNLGIAFNFRRAEKFAFEQLKEKAALFLEDDFVLEPSYLQTIHRMYNKYRDVSEIGMLSATGRIDVHWSNANEPLACVELMHHNWAFLLKQEAWVNREVKLEHYYNLLRGRTYSARPHNAIFEWLKTLGASEKVASSQDAVKNFLLHLDNKVRVNTVAPFGKYIGEQGEHFTKAQFDNMGFSEISTSKVVQKSFPELDRESIKNFHKEQEKHFIVQGKPSPSKQFEKEPDSLLIDEALEKFNEVGHMEYREVDTMAVIFAYNYLLNRNPESPEAIAEKLKIKSVAELRSVLLASPEAREKLSNALSE